jgi:sugar/nucleoside kinase (ribokinase family)
MNQTVTDTAQPAVESVPPVPPPAPPELIGVGSPLVDLVLPVDDAFLAKHLEGEKGGMVMVEAKVIERLLAAARRQGDRSPGGAAANTTVGCANLGVRAAFIGACGDDELGAYYREALRAQGCEPRLIVQQKLPTGRVLAMVTPDAERTMRTCLGAAAALDPASFTAATFAGARVVVLEGYTLFNHALTRAVAKAAKAAGCALALDFASFEVVKANRAVIEELIAAGRVDLAFANQDEAAMWNMAGPEAALDDLARRVGVVAVKLGKEGALIARGAERVRVPAQTVTAVDTTGAGDAWAAGFLAGWLRGLPLTQCGKLGAQSGAAVVQVMGAQPPREAWLRIKGYLDAWT